MYGERILTCNIRNPTTSEARTGTEVAIALSQEAESWFALTVLPRHEKVAAQNLRLRGLKEFLPLYRARRRWSDRISIVELPLFPGYVFCRFGYRDRLKVCTTPGILSIVGFGKEAAPIEDDEIHSIQTILKSGLPVQPRPLLKVGGIVRIERGPLAGVQGRILREKGAWRVVVTVELLQRSVVVEADRESIEPWLG